MFLSVRELELRKIRFDKIFESGQIEFTGEDLEQGSPLHAKRFGRVVAGNGRASANLGELHRGNSGAVRPLSGARALSAESRVSICTTGPPRMFRKRKRSRSTRGKRKLGFMKTAWNWRTFSGSKSCWRCRCSGCAARPVKGSAPFAERTGTRPRAIVSPKWTIAGARSVTWNSEYCRALARGQ